MHVCLDILNIVYCRSIGADFYIANGHKWFGAAKVIEFTVFFDI